VLDSAARCGLHLHLRWGSGRLKLPGFCLEDLPESGHWCFVLVRVLQIALVFQVLAEDFQQITCKAIEKVLSISRTWEQDCQCFI